MEVQEILIPLLWGEGPKQPFELRMGLSIVEFSHELRKDWLKGGKDFRVHRVLHLATHALHGCSPRTPQAVLLNHESERIEDFLTSLRLLVEGDIGRGPQYQRMLVDGHVDDSAYMFHPIWEAPFRVNTSKVSTADLSAAENLSERVKTLRTANPNLSLALRRFNYSYTRDLPADELLDLTVGLESLFAVDGPGEIGYKIAARSARLLSYPPKEHDIAAVRALYKVRSEIVHGGHYEKIQDSKALIRLAGPNVRLPSGAHETVTAARQVARNYVRAALRAYLAHPLAGDANGIVKALDMT
ncbi:MAG TPA: hypothetical protein VM286_02800 [Candidatus Thermoplasmatota archaeon]|nr:hypothetical protein [Candidatus Thermoplasmatota archaeon]